MRKALFLLIIIFYINCFAYELKINKSDRLAIEQSPKKSAILKRLEEYKIFQEEVRVVDINKKISLVNFFINKTLPEFDSKSVGIDDYWMTPKEFLIKGYGDCEDYAIAKYFTLLNLGVNKEYLYLAIVDVKGSLTSHMVLLYAEDKNSSPLVLDNLSFRVLTLEQREDLIPKLAFNEIDSYQISSKKFLRPVSIDWQNDNKWEKLLQRVYILDE